VVLGLSMMNLDRWILILEASLFNVASVHLCQPPGGECGETDYRGSCVVGCLVGDSR